jgi:hypothetical protein
MAPEQARNVISPIELDAAPFHLTTESSGTRGDSSGVQANG